MDQVHLAVAEEEAVAALAAGQLVALRVADRAHVLAGERPQHVVTVPA